MNEVKDVIIREIEMPMALHGFVKVDDEGLGNIYINQNLSDYLKQKTIKHEIEHLKNGDFEKDLSVEAVEAADKAEADLSEICIIGRGETEAPDKVLKVMSYLADGAKIIHI
jgi:hypothetical protein